MQLKGITKEASDRLLSFLPQNQNEHTTFCTSYGLQLQIDGLVDRGFIYIMDDYGRISTYSVNNVN